MRRGPLWVPVGIVAGLLVSAGHSPGAGRPDGRLQLPVTGAALTQPYGCTELELEPAEPSCPGGHFHAGLDLAAPAGTPVRAAAAGTAQVAAGWAGYGLHVVIQHGGGLATLYAHLQSARVRTGDVVFAGAEIGRLGSTGLSTGPHLHFEVRREGRPADPVPLLPAIS